MLILKRTLLRILCAGLGLITVACGSSRPVSACGEGIGFTANETQFAQHFTQMELVNATTGQPGQPDPEGGGQFAATDSLTIQTESLAEVVVRACVQERTSDGKIVLDQSQTVRQGADHLALGSFAPGRYVVRVIVEGVLVQNLPFAVK